MILLSPKRAHDGMLRRALKPLVGAISVERMREANLTVDATVRKKLLDIRPYRISAKGEPLPNMRLATLAAALFIAAAPFAAALAADASYLGPWKLSEAVVAPWADPAQRKPDKAEPARLLGKTLVFKTGEIAGPQPFACKKARYALKDYAANMIFQGAFEEMQTKDKSADPQKIAATLGFPAAGIKTLETGCELDFHFVDGTTAKAGLNDYVYTLKKQ